MKILIYIMLLFHPVFCQAYQPADSLKKLFNKIEGLEKLKLQSIQDYTKITEIYQNISEIYSELGKNKKAYESYLTYKLYKDTLMEQENRNKIKILKNQYDLVNKDKEIEILQKGNELKELALHKNLNERNSYLTGIVMILFTSLILFSRYRIKIRTAAVLKKKNIEIENVNEELSIINNKISDKNLTLEKLNKQQHEVSAAKDKLFSIIAHDLKNPFNSIIGLSSLLTEDFDLFDREQKKEFALNINNSAHEAHKLLENLLEWSCSQSGQTEFNPKETDLEQITSDTFRTLNQQAQIKNINLISEIQERTMVFADENMISTVIRNLLSNAIKFTDNGGRISISAQKYGDMVKITIQDTGIGISKENLNKLFRVDAQYKTIGTANEKGTGLGLLLCKEFVEKNNGHIRVESEVGKGSKFIFTLPNQQNINA